jgi:hypothetical protein
MYCGCGCKWQSRSKVDKYENDHHLNINKTPLLTYSKYKIEGSDPKMSSSNFYYPDDKKAPDNNSNILPWIF